ncbi:A-kinase anchor protein 6, partial [Dissostichus eleginoides]
MEMVLIPDTQDGLSMFLHINLEDICEDISDHVEQIHALLETEFSLKLLSYSVNIIVDIRTVQLLWHQLRVSVLVLKERLLQGLQDSNGNFTRQTDILQAFSQDQDQTRLDALTEEDDFGQLTIRCSQDYFSLDCGITAFELSDYSPGDESEAREAEVEGEDVAQVPETTQVPHPEPEEEPEPEGEDVAQKPEKTPSPHPDPELEPEESLHSLSNHKFHNTLPELPNPADSTNHNLSVLPTMQCNESAKRHNSTEVSPTQPSRPKRAALFSNGGGEGSRGGTGNESPISGLHFQAELSRSTPSLVDPLDRSKFWLELDSVYSEDVSQSYESLQIMNGRNVQRNRLSSRQGGRSQRPMPDQRSSSGAKTSTEAPLPPGAPRSQGEISRQDERRQGVEDTLSEGDSDSSLPSPMREQFLSSDMEASGEESEPQPRPGNTAVWIVKRPGKKQQESQVSSGVDPQREHWYGSEEFLALPAQLRKTEMLAMKLESLAHSLPTRPGGCDSTQDALQDVDDWELTELNQDWELDEMPSLLPPLLPYRRNLVSRFSSASSSDIAPSLDESMESGPLSASLVQRLLQDLQNQDHQNQDHQNQDRQNQDLQNQDHQNQDRQNQDHQNQDLQNQDKDPDVWKKIEGFVQQLDGFISWLQESLDSTENWTQPRQELESLRVYLDTHLSFKLNVESRSALKENIMEEGRALLTVISSHQSGLKEILHMVSSQWDHLLRQIRRQHGWMLRALRCIQARVLYTGQSHEPSGEPSANREAACPSDGLKTTQRGREEKCRQ